MNTSNLFNSSYSTSNPFNISGNSNPNDTSSIENSLMDTYAKIEALKARQNQLNSVGNSTQQIQQMPQTQVATVFSDISNELSNISSDELSFITSSQEYQELNSKYQSEFTQFLISKFSNEYLQRGNGRTLEEMLHTIRTKKEQYKSKFAADVNEIRDQNKILLEKNNSLAETNLALQNQLKEIQEKLKTVD